MKYSEQLFNLIESMTKTEKRYFKVHALKYKGDHYYLDLFDAIDKQATRKKTYNEIALLEQFKDQLFFKNFAVATAYLYKKILLAMREFNSKGATEDELMSGIISDIRYLIKKSLFLQAKKLLLKAHRLADKNECFIDKLNLIKIEFFLVSYGVFKESMEDSYDRLYELEIYCMNCIKKISDYKNLSTKMYLKYLSFDQEDSNKLFQELSELNNHPLLKNESALDLYNTKIYYYAAKSIYYKTIKNYEKSFLYHQKRFELYNEYPQFIKNAQAKYVSVLNNLLMACVEAGNRSAFEYYLNVLRSFQSKEKTILCAIFSSSYYVEMHMYIKNKRYKDALKIVPEIEDGLLTYKGSIRQLKEQNLLFVVACLYFRIKEYNKAIKWINKILNFKDTNLQSYYFQSASRIMQLFIYYERKDFESLPYLLLSTQRFFMKKGEMFDIESKAISIIKSLLKNIEKKEEQKLYDNFKEDVSMSKELMLKRFIGHMGF